MEIIQLKKVTKIYGKDQYAVKALNNVSLSVEEGEFLSIMGPSGSGKSTLLNIIGCMDKVTEGEYLLKGKQINGFSHKGLSDMRNHMVSFVFQHFALLQDYTVYENIELPLVYRKISQKEKKEKIYHYMNKLGIAELARKKPKNISGGQQQRVAIARALVSEAEVILADEPTGALDQKTGLELLELLTVINKEGKTIIMVTHDPKVASFSRRSIHINDGMIVQDVENRKMENYIVHS